METDSNILGSILGSPPTFHAHTLTPIMNKASCYMIYGLHIRVLVGTYLGIYYKFSSGLI